MIDNKYYSGKKDRCHLCKNFNIKDFYLIEKFKFPFNISKCESCNFIFMNPPFKKEIRDDFYNKDYYTGHADYSYFDERKSKKFSDFVYNKRIDFINKYIEKGNFLDIGSSFGGLLESAERYYTPHGIDISDYAVEYISSRKGYPVHKGGLDNHPFEKDYFSVITMIELIEHLEDPVFAIKEVYNLLEDNGLFVIQTANMNSLQAKKYKSEYHYFLPGHLSYFTKENLKNILLEIGFTRVKIYQPVEFGLLPKLKKSRGDFKKFIDYKSWIRIILYHFLGKIHWGNFSATASMVIYAFKDKEKKI
jgi:SAM-dependent methyltransferase